MKNLQILAAIAGICFGLWPIVANKSGVKPYGAALIISAVGFIFIIPMCMMTGGIQSIKMGNWKMLILAGVISTVGFLCINESMSKVDVKRVSELIMILLLVDAVVQGGNHLLTNGGLSLSKLAGFLLGGIAIWLLIKK
jgi:drug/metabolite transporter (DMT)-like permease